MFCPMDPRIEDSVTCIGPDRWLLGSLYICEVVSVPSDAAVAIWEENGKTYCIRTSSGDERRGLNDSAANRIHHAGTSAAVWNIGGMYIKVKAWRQNMQLESDTIRFVKRMSSVPTPEVVTSWIDVAWDRSFLILKAMDGQTLDEVWTSLSTNQCVQIAGEVAKYCKELALITSKRLTTATEHGVIEPFLTVYPPDIEPSWRPQILGPYTSDQLRSYLSGSAEWDGHTELFYFYHADLGPTNIVIENGSIAGIIDWESAAYYPRFWLGTKPCVSAGFYLQIARAEKRAWASLLEQSLEREGFPPDMETYQMWRKAVER